jgi:hypothetical protein
MPKQKGVRKVKTIPRGLAFYYLVVALAGAKTKKARERILKLIATFYKARDSHNRRGYRRDNLHLRFMSTKHRPDSRLSVWR